MQILIHKHERVFESFKNVPKQDKTCKRFVKGNWKMKRREQQTWRAAVCPTWAWLLWQESRKEGALAWKSLGLQCSPKKVCSGLMKCPQAKGVVNRFLCENGLASVPSLCSVAGRSPGEAWLCSECSGESRGVQPGFGLLCFCSQFSCRNSEQTVSMVAPSRSTSYKFGEQLIHDAHVPLRRRSLVRWFVSPVTEEPKLVLIDSVFHHPVSLARLGCLPNGVTQTFVSEVFEPLEIIPFSGWVATYISSQL